MTRFAAPDWTLDRYRELLDAAAARLRFEPFGTKHTGPHVLWRHDIDYSLDHALTLARIEAQRGLRATYFLLLGSPYYNLFSPAAREQVRELVALGHWIGHHFDPECHAGLQSPGSLEAALAEERGILANLARAPVDVMSFHNPAFSGALAMDRDELGGMINVYGARIRGAYVYCSDSFGYWRHTPLHEVLAQPPSSMLHILTHPVWWRQMPMGSRQRIKACVEEQALALAGIHDALLTRAGQIHAVVEADRRRGFHSPPPPSETGGGSNA
jgi:hypothetical protein